MLQDLNAEITKVIPVLLIKEKTIGFFIAPKIGYKYIQEIKQFFVMDKKSLYPGQDYDQLISLVVSYAVSLLGLTKRDSMNLILSDIIR